MHSRDAKRVVGVGNHMGTGDCRCPGLIMQIMPLVQPLTR